MQDVGVFRAALWKAARQFGILRGYIRESGSQFDGAFTHITVLIEDIERFNEKHSVITWAKVSVPSNIK